MAGLTHDLKEQAGQVYLEGAMLHWAQRRGAGREEEGVELDSFELALVEARVEAIREDFPPNRGCTRMERGLREMSKRLLVCWSLGGRRGKGEL